MIKKGELYYSTKEFKKRACLKNRKIYLQADKNPVKFWEKLAKELFWFKAWKKTFIHKPPYFQWFVGGKINITENIFEKNLQGWEKIRNKIAVIWEPEPLKEEPRTLTYQELFQKVNKFANVLKGLGVKNGDRVGIYLPMIPEVIISILACARIGAVHTVVFSAFSSSALRIRLQIAEAKILITADGYYRRGQIINLKAAAEEGAKETKVEKVIVVKRAGNEISWNSQKDLWWDELIKTEKEQCEAEIMDAEDILFLLATSGSTGTPKMIVHTCGGYMVQAFWTGKWIFDFQTNDIFWCTADIGWITSHTYGAYAPLLNGITIIMFEGAPDWPTPDRWAQIIEKHKVTIFYTAPTAIRMFEKYGLKVIEKYKFKTLRLLGSVGEPIDEAAWLWYFEKVGKKRCPIVDTWWQTETGGILITSLPGIGPFKPAYIGLPFPGIKVEILAPYRAEGSGAGLEDKRQSGDLVILPPFSPGMFREIYKDSKKYSETYWSKYGKKIYFTSDAAFKDKNGLIRIIGRVDDVIKVAGHRLSTGELEAAVNLHPDITESAVIGIPDEIKGEALVVFIVSTSRAAAKGREESNLSSTSRAVARGREEGLKKEILSQIRKEIGPIALPKEIYLVENLPKTRSGKIMRRILRKLTIGEELGDLSTLANPESVNKIREIISPSSRTSQNSVLYGAG